MGVHNLASITTRNPQLTLRTRSELLSAGDRVTIGSKNEPLYRIVHISEQKAWVCPLRDGAPRIIRTGELRLIGAQPTCVLMLN